MQCCTARNAMLHVMQYAYFIIIQNIICFYFRSYIKESHNLTEGGAIISDSYNSDNYVEIDTVTETDDGIEHPSVGDDILSRTINIEDGPIESENCENNSIDIENGKY